MTLVTCGKGPDAREVLFSYETPVAARIGGTYYKSTAFHSTTTARHMAEYIGANGHKDETQEWFDNL